MLFDDWYGDSIDIYRVEDTIDGFETKKGRVLVRENIPCRVYEKEFANLQINKGAGNIESQLKIALDIDTNIKSGDEVIVKRQGETETTRYLVGSIKPYRMPIGNDDTGLEHKEVLLKMKIEP